MTSENIMITCDAPFEVHGSGCYYFGTSDKNWMSAEADCQTYRRNVHLAGMETSQVRVASLLSFM